MAAELLPDPLPHDPQPQRVESVEKGREDEKGVGKNGREKKEREGVGKKKKGKRRRERKGG